jgi:hypothetical protein
MKPLQRAIDVQAEQARETGTTPCWECRNIATKLGLRPEGGWDPRLSPNGSDKIGEPESLRDFIAGVGGRHVEKRYPESPKMVGTLKEVWKQILDNTPADTLAVLTIGDTWSWLDKLAKTLSKSIKE